MLNLVKNISSPLILALLGAFLIVGTAFAADNTVVVTGNTAGGENQPGWLFNRDSSTSTPYEFNADEASVGVGSLYVKPIGTTSSDKFIGEYFALEEMGNVESFSYDYKIGSGGTASDANEFYLNVYANFAESDATKFYDCRYEVVPTSGSTTNFTTVTFDPNLTYPVTTRSTSPIKPCPSSPSAMGDDATLRAFAINVGDTSTNDAGLNGYLDNVVLKASGDTTTFDFEPATTPSSKDECKNGGWTSFNTPSFKNQGQCVSYVASSGKSNR